VPLLEQARTLKSEVALGGVDSPRAFSKLLQLILTSTIVKEEERLECSKVNIQDSNNPQIIKTEWNIESVKRGIPLRLNDGRFLSFKYTVTLNSKSKLSVVKSSVQYQKDSNVNNLGEIFRYDYQRPTLINSPSAKSTNTPSSAHLHIYGQLYLHKDISLYKKKLERQHFPCGRTSIESIIRLLQREFMTPIHQGLETKWLELLDITETLFKQK
jgi:hypothetical protein